MTIFGDLNQNKLWVICNNLNQFAHLSSASGPSNDVIKMAAIVLLMYTYKTSYLKQKLREFFFARNDSRLYLTDWTSNNTKKMCSHFFQTPRVPFGAPKSINLTQIPLLLLYSCRKFVLKLSDFCSGLVNLGPFYTKYEVNTVLYP